MQHSNQTASDMSAPRERTKRRHKEIRLRGEKKGNIQTAMQRQRTGVDSEKTSLPAKSKRMPGNAERLSKIHKETIK